MALRSAGARSALAVLLAVVACTPLRAQDEEKLERLLARLGLVDLQILHLEKSLENASLAPADRERLALRLADLYAEQLMNSAGNQARYDDLVARIQSLLTRFPRANTTALQVMLLQADYNRAEGQIAEWIADRGKAQALADASVILQTIAPQLDDHQRRLGAQVDGLFAEMEKLSDASPDLLAKENEARRLQAIWGRAAYFAGWANYYLGLTKATGGQAEYRRASEIFRKLLSLDEGDLAKVDPQSLSLEVIWRARAAIGLGLAESAVGNVEASRAAFRWLEHASTPPEVQDQAPYWFVQGLLNAGRWDEARRFAEAKIQAYSGGATQGKVSLCVALVRAGFGDAATAANVRDLGMFGIVGLARLGQYNAAQQLLEKYGIEPDEQSGFFLAWMQGRKLFARAQASKQKEDYLAAAGALSAALERPDAATQTAAQGHCRYELGWCYYRAGDFEAAARQFELAVTPLKTAGAQEAASAAWMAFVAFKQLADEQPRYAASAIHALQAVKRDFPYHEYAKNADYHLTKLQRAVGSSQESLQNLLKIPASDPNYLTARYDICVLLHQQWSEAATARDKAAALDKLRQAADDYVRAAGVRGDRERSLRVLLLVIAAAQGGESPDPALADNFLARAAPLAENAPDASSAKVEFTYRQMQAARRKNDAAASLAHARWLLDHGGGSPYEVSALIEIARDLDRRREAASDAERATLQEEAYQVYTRLVERLGDSPSVLQSQKNAKVALARLAEIAVATERYEEASRRLTALLAVEPKSQVYLRLAGLANFRAGKYDASLEHWRTLTLGLPRGSEEWFEAKYYQIASLAEIDRSQARTTLQQLQLLYPTADSSAWQEKFASLAQRLK